MNFGTYSRGLFEPPAHYDAARRANDCSHVRQEVAHVGILYGLEKSVAKRRRGRVDFGDRSERGSITCTDPRKQKKVKLGPHVGGRDRLIQ